MGGYSVEVTCEGRQGCVLVPAFFNLYFDAVIHMALDLTKIWLVVKEDQYENAVKCFEDTDVQITTSGKGYLGSTLGTSSFKETYVQLKVDK